MTRSIRWEEASARRLERRFLANPLAAGDGGPAEIVAAMAGAHARVPSAAEVSVGIRAEGMTRTDVRAALTRDRSLVRTHGPRGTVHLLPARELALWTSALTAVPSGRRPLPPEVRLTEAQAEQVAAAVGEAPTYTRPPRFDPLPPGQALRLLVGRHLAVYGPATPQDFAKWLAAPPGWAATLFGEALGAGELEEVLFEGRRAWVAAGDTGFPQEPARGVRLLPYFDAYVVAAQPRELLFPGAAHGRAPEGGQAGNFPVLLVDGAVAGVWHQRRRGRRTTSRWSRSAG